MDVNIKAHERGAVRTCFKCTDSLYTNIESGLKVNNALLN